MFEWVKRGRIKAGKGLTAPASQHKMPPEPHAHHPPRSACPPACALDRRPIQWFH